eukprot:CAMPEP_0172696356 /NCGR_PEP_ID=MMETSP1074-20121228/27996_1 /TAXON_ID=2916 /ORGANISM="Ceratium fusus, Strain PA161109" /LENGTH=121 /DNA_ID=CAMNT_0013517093 /DNA_START=12 /DNA_END=373 /DNA_ORIENTATION=+
MTSVDGWIPSIHRDQCSAQIAPVSNSGPVDVIPGFLTKFLKLFRAAGAQCTNNGLGQSRSVAVCSSFASQVSSAGQILKNAIFDHHAGEGYGGGSEHHLQRPLQLCPAFLLNTTEVHISLV